MSNWGFVYCMANESMPGVYKIGYTASPPNTRAEQLSHGTGVPSPYKVLFYAEMPSAMAWEKVIHQELSEYRVSENREFFKVDAEEIRDWIYEFHRIESGSFSESFYYQQLKCEEEFEKYKAGLDK